LVCFKNCRNRKIWSSPFFCRPLTPNAIKADYNRHRTTNHHHH
jgi:hypothetical protein